MSPSVHPGLPSQRFAVFDRSPLATVVLRCGDGGSSTLVGQIDYVNAAARQLFSKTSPASEDPSIFELVGPSAHVELRRILTHTPVPDARPHVVLVTASGCAGSVDGESAVDGTGDLFQMHLQRHVDSGRCVAHLVPVSRSDADRVIAEQQRFRSALMELSELAHTTEDDNEFYQTLIERAVEVVPGAQGGSVQLNVKGTPSFRFVAAVGYDLEGLQRHELEQEHFFRDAWDPVAQIVRDFHAEGRTPEITEWLETVGRLSEIVVNVSAPVLSEGFPVAFLSLDNFEDENSINATSVEMTTVLSRLIGELLRRRDLEAEVRKEREAFRHLALHDPLTGLANRRNLERSLADHLVAARVAERPAAVLFVDVDDFKSVNDRLGHDAGDRLLIGIADGLKKAARQTDLVSRWGGDEFLILARRVDSLEQVQVLADRILEQFSASLDLGDDVMYRARLSVGVGWSTDSHIGMDRLIGLADRALYEAKASGKGVSRVCDAANEHAVATTG